MVANKEKGQRDTVVKLNPSAFARFYGPVPQGIEEPTTNRLVVGWIPTRSAIFNSAPLAATNYLKGLASGKTQDRVATPTAIVDLSPEEIKVQNDLPQLPDRDGQGWFLREKQNPTIQVHSMREEIQPAARKAV
jgi:hypothetical protein